MTSLPLRYYTSARSDFQSAQIVLFQIIADRDDYRHKSAAFLAGFSVELYLKAWLSCDGVEEKTLCSADVRHNLSILFQMAIDQGYCPSHHDIKTIIEKFDKIHRKFETRYLKPDTEIPRLVLAGYSTAMEALDFDVRIKLGLPPST